MTEHDPHSPGCLVLDVSMPHFSGLELQQALADQGNKVPIKFLTGRADVPDLGPTVCTPSKAGPSSSLSLRARSEPRPDHHR
ncbi:response regulator [bacterium]|nr:response regulator [bacterium]